MTSYFSNGARKLWFAGFVVLVFGIGVGAGMAVDRYVLYGVSTDGPGSRDGGRFRTPPPPTEVADRMTRELGLSAEQRVEIEAVFARGAERLEAFRQQSREQFDSLRAQLHEEIEAVLTPEQRQAFQESRQNRRRGGDRPPPERRR